MVNIIYEDKDILVCHKQAGIAVQTRRIGQADMESELKNYRISKGEEPYIGIIHRLDQPVEGLLVFAKNPVSAANLSKQVAMRQIAKYYYALVHMPEESGMSGDICPKGLQQENSQLENFRCKDLPPENSQCENLPPKNFGKENNQKAGSTWITLTDFLVRDGKTNTSRVVLETASGAKRAVLEYQIIQCRDGVALLDIHLHTGRHHQIRVQMAHAGMPLVGDRKYGERNTDTAGWNPALSNKKEDSQSDGDKIDGAEIEKNCSLALCAYRLEFVHPASKEKMSFEIKPQWAEL